MSDFVETSKSRNAKRTYTPIANVAAFAEAVAAFTTDSTMGLTRKEKSAETYKAKIITSTRTPTRRDTSISTLMTRRSTRT